MNNTTHHLFHSMGIPVHVTIVGVKETDAKKYITKVENIFNSYDKRFSRFKETSELHKLNTANGELFPVGIQMYEILKKCVLLAEETNGAFDPSVGTLLASYGYGLPKNLKLPDLLPTYSDIEFNDRDLSVRLAKGQILEPASIVKGIAIDDAGRSLLGVPGFLINAGGDIITHGAFDGDSLWNIAIQDPRNSSAIVATVGVRDAGMATSGTYQTKGIHQNKKWHHLIDMRTGESSDGVVSATVIAHTCEEADTEATLAILLSLDEAISRLEAKRLPYFLVTKDGMALKSSSFSALEVPIQTLVS